MTKSIILGIFCVALCCVTLVEPVVLPASFKICPRATPDLAACIKNSIEFIRPNLKTGDFGSGFKVEPLEPLQIDDFTIKRNGFFVAVTNLKAHGATNFRINKLRVNIDQFKVDVILDVPKIEAFGQYKLNMVIGVLNLKGEGNMQVAIDNIKLRLTILGSRYINPRDRQEYIKADQILSRVKIVNMRLHFDNLFNSDRTLGDLGNSLINQNIDMFVNDIEAVLQKSLSKQFLKSANQIMDKAPFNVFLP